MPKWIIYTGLLGVGAAGVIIAQSLRTNEPSTAQRARELADSAQREFCAQFPDSPLCLDDWSRERPIAVAPVPITNPNYGEVLV